MRSVIERFLALFLLLVLSPVLGVIAFLIWRDSSGPIIFRQIRVGYKGKSFIFYKFRTMYDQSWPDQDIPGEDPRVTCIGRRLRKSHIDELPQLWNVVLGDMVFIGPRPQPLKLSEQFESIYPKRYRNRFLIPAGITGLAQLYTEKGHCNDLFQSIVYDELYRLKRSLCLDLLIGLKTIYKMSKCSSH